MRTISEEELVEMDLEQDLELEWDPEWEWEWEWERERERVSGTGTGFGTVCVWAGSRRKSNFAQFGHQVLEGGSRGNQQ